MGKTIRAFYTRQDNTKPLRKEDCRRGNRRELRNSIRAIDDPEDF